MAVIPAALAVVMTAFGIESTAVGRSVHGNAECDGDDIIACNTPSGDPSDALALPILAIRHSPCGMCSGFKLKRDSSLVVVRSDCQWLARIGYRWSAL